MSDDDVAEVLRRMLDRPGEVALRLIRDQADRRILDDLGPTRDPATDPHRCTFEAEAGRCYLDAHEGGTHTVAAVRRRMRP